MAAVGAREEVLRLRVDGMGCSACTVKAKQVLEQLDGVAECTVDLASESARVTLAAPGGDEGSAAAAAQRITERAQEALAGAGFSATAMP